MKASERALSFITRAYDGKVRRESKLPAVVHSMIVGDLLKSYGFDDEEVAAGYLHDIVEETDYTIDDIARLFGGKIASLVMTATDADKSLPWKARKTQKIKNSKDLPISNKAIIIADRIANLEEKKISYLKTGYVDFSLYHGNFEDQRWYNECMLGSLETGPINPEIDAMLDRLALSIQKLFYNKKISKNETRILSKMQANGRTEELLALRNILEDKKPFVIEFAGTPKEEPASLLNVINDFFKQSSFKVKVIEETGDSTPGKTQDDFITDSKSLTDADRNFLIASEIECGLLSDLSSGHDVILLNRGLFERLVWIQRYLETGVLTEEDFNSYIEFYMPTIENIINYTVISSTGKLSVTEQSIIPRKKDAMAYCQTLLNGDSLTNDKRDTTLRLLENLLPVMREDYIRQLKLMLEQKKDKVN